MRLRSTHLNTDRRKVSLVIDTLDTDVKRHRLTFLRKVSPKARADLGTTGVCVAEEIQYEHRLMTVRS